MYSVFALKLKFLKPCEARQRLCQTSRCLSGAFWRSLESLMLLLWRHQGVQSDEFVVLTWTAKSFLGLDDWLPAETERLKKTIEQTMTLMRSTSVKCPSIVGKAFCDDIMTICDFYGHPQVLTLVGFQPDWYRRMKVLVMSPQPVWNQQHGSNTNQRHGCWMSGTGHGCCWKSVLGGRSEWRHHPSARSCGSSTPIPSISAQIVGETWWNWHDSWDIWHVSESYWIHHTESKPSSTKST